jgi:hypothetical protein
MDDERSHMITIEAQPQPILVDLARTAVLVVDMQNAFVHKAGYFDLAGFVGQDRTMSLKGNG